MVIFDTNVLISAMKGDREAIRVIKSFKNESPSISILNKYELLKGRKFVDIEVITSFIRNMKVYNLTDQAVDTASKIYLDLSKGGITIDEFDVLIAAIAISNDETLVTFDKDFERIKSGKIVVLK